jgi:hypothetical protein
MSSGLDSRKVGLSSILDTSRLSEAVSALLFHSLARNSSTTIHYLSNGFQIVSRIIFFSLTFSFFSCACSYLSYHLSQYLPHNI